MLLVCEQNEKDCRADVLVLDPNNQAPTLFEVANCASANSPSTGWYGNSPNQGINHRASKFDSNLGSAARKKRALDAAVRSTCSCSCCASPNSPSPDSPPMAADANGLPMFPCLLLSRSLRSAHALVAGRRRCCARAGSSGAICWRPLPGRGTRVPLAGRLREPLLEASPAAESSETVYVVSLVVVHVDL
jgi:hypothetical protein